MGELIIVVADDDAKIKGEKPFGKLLSLFSEASRNGSQDIMFVENEAIIDDDTEISNVLTHIS